MSDTSSPYVTRCKVCSQGLLRAWLCGSCNQVAAICDECESVWSNIPHVFEQNDTRPDGSYPSCPACRASGEWTQLDAARLAALGLDGCIGGYSE